MPEGNGSRDLGTLGIEWNDQQLEQVRAVFDSVDESSADSDLRASIFAQTTDSAAEHVVGVGVFRDLLRVETRPERFRRLLAIWSGRVGTAIRDGDYASAGTWMRALTEAPVFAEEFAQIVAEARRDLSTRELFDGLVLGLVEAGSPSEVAPLLSTWGEPLVEYLISQVVADEPIVNRRHIVDYLGVAGRGDVRHLTARLADPRWFVVRNVVIAIGKAGRASALPALESVFEHEDDRVRVEVIRSLGVLEPDESIPFVLGALADPSPKVRQAAASLIRASPSESVVPGIVDVLERGIGSAEEGRRLVEIVAERRGPGVEEALHRLARRRVALGAGKAIRDAARTALAGRIE